MIFHFRCGDIEADLDTEGDGITPEAAETYLLRVARVAYSTWVAMPNVEPAAIDEADAAD